MDRFRTTAAKHFGWFDRSYIIDWAIASVLWVLSFFVKTMSVYEREFDVKDPLISHPHGKQQISGHTNAYISLFVPAMVFVVGGLLRKSTINAHHSLLALWASRGMSALLTDFIKNRVGRLRPDFLSRCKWSASKALCKGNVDAILDGRRSFPSGHSSTAFAGMTLLSLYIAGTTGAWNPSASRSTHSILRSRLLRLTLSIAPLVWALWVAISRVEDYRHHKEDVIVGSLIGITTSFICYLLYFPNPFTTQEMGEPRASHSDSVNGRFSHDSAYELARLEEDIGHV